MRFRKSIVSAVGAVSVLVTIGYASAEPAPVATATARCWLIEGVRLCRSFGSRYDSYGSRYREYNNPDDYRAGSSEWWQEMDRQNRGGRR